MRKETIERLQLLQRVEQLAAGLAAGDKAAENKARAILGQVALHGDCELLADVFKGIILAWNAEQKDWEKYFP